MSKSASILRSLLSNCYPFLQSLKSFLTLRIVFTALLVFVLGLNGKDLFLEIKTALQDKERISANFLGVKFSGLEQTLEGQEYVGYMTDKDLDDKQNAAQLAQAQYTLAPIILDLNNTDHDFIFFDYENERQALKKIRKINAVPIRKNQYGIILAQKMKQRKFRR